MTKSVFFDNKKNLMFFFQGHDSRNKQSIHPLWKQSIYRSNVFFWNGKKYYWKLSTFLFLRFSTTTNNIVICLWGKIFFYKILKKPNLEFQYKIWHHQYRLQKLSNIDMLSILTSSLFFSCLYENQEKKIFTISYLCLAITTKIKISLVFPITKYNTIHYCQKFIIVSEHC